MRGGACKSARDRLGLSQQEGVNDTIEHEGWTVTERGGVGQPRMILA